MIFFRQGIQNRPGKTSFIGTGLPSQYGNGALVNTQRFIRDHQILVKFHLITQSKTIRTGAKRIIKGKTSRLHLINADTAIRTSKVLAEIQHLPICHIHHHQAIAQAHGCFNRICQTLFNARTDDQTIYHDLNVVLDILIQMDLFRKLILVSIDPDPHKSTLLGLV